MTDEPENPRDMAHPTFVERFAQNRYSSPAVRLSEAQILLIEFPQGVPLKKWQKALSDAHFKPLDATNTVFVAEANATNRVNADRLVREINGRPLEYYAGMRR